MIITRRQLKRLIREAVFLEQQDPPWPRQAQSKLRYALVDYIDAYTLKAGLNPGNRRDSQRIHSEIDSIVDSILGI